MTKKGNNALKESERTNFIEHIRNALDNSLSFKIIVDESHQNDTIKADDIIELFHSDKIIRCSATPKNYKDAILIDIPEEDVIAEGLIKKLLIINENFEQHISVDDRHNVGQQFCLASVDIPIHFFFALFLKVTFAGSKPNKYRLMIAFEILVHKI